jgi:nucleoside-diphosphate-sugar epimerase
MNRRIAIVGANGRLGSELSLRLNPVSDVDLVGICRNIAGSAYLRKNNVVCRVGSLNDAAMARALVHDADVIVNLAYTFPRSIAGHRSNVAAIENVVAAAKPGAILILASTIMVYGPAFQFRCPDAYGLEKLRLERAFHNATEHRDLSAHVFRIGHAIGDLQPLTRQIHEELQRGKTSVGLDSDTPSNTIHVASLAQAVHQASSSYPRVADLVTEPSWSWGDLYSWYAGDIESVTSPMNWAAEPWRAKRVARELGLVASLALPERISARMYGRYLVARAKNELAASSTTPSGPCGIEATGWRGLKGMTHLPGLCDPLQAIERYPIGIDGASRPMDR